MPDKSLGPHKALQGLTVIYIMNCLSNELRLQFIRLVVESSWVSSIQKRNAPRQALRISEDLPHSYKLRRQQQKTGCISPNTINSRALAVFTLKNAETKNRMHLTKPYEYLRRGCIHTKLQKQTWWISAKPRTSIRLITLTAIKAIVNRSKMHLTEPSDLLWIGCIHTISRQHQTKTACISPKPDNSCSRLHSHQIRPQRKTGCISPKPRNCFG